MKQILLLITLLLAPNVSSSLNIRQVVISAVSNDVINVSLDTEAAELYYFSSWSHEVSSEVITVNAYFVKGFGSTIAYLNNNFEIPVDTAQEHYFRFRVEVYYEMFNGYSLQDYVDGIIQYPVVFPVSLSTIGATLENETAVLYTNPSNGIITLKTHVVQALICDLTGRIIRVFEHPNNIIDISNLPKELYFVVFFSGQRRIQIKVFLQKE